MASPSQPTPAPGTEGYQPGETFGSRSDVPLTGTAMGGQSGASVRRRDASVAGQPGWRLWLPLGLSTALLVLFAVVVNRQQSQAERISELMERVQSLEHSRTLERTAVLEQQLRSMLSRLQDLEKKEQRQSELGRQLQNLQQELQQLRAASSRQSDPLREPTLIPETPRRPTRPTPPVTPLTP